MMPSAEYAKRTALLLPASLLLVVMFINHTMALRLTSLGIAFLIGVAFLVRDRLFPPPLRVIGIWIVFSALSITWSMNPQFSAGEIKSELIYGLLAFVALYGVARDRFSLRFILHSAAAGVLATGTIALFFRSQLADPAAYNFEAVHGFGTFSTYLAVVFPVLLYLLVTEWRNRLRRAVILLALALAFYTAFLTLNRMFWIAAGVSGALMLLLASRNIPRERRAMIGLIAAGVIGLFSVLLVAVGAHRLGSASGHNFIEATIQHSERLEIWRYWLGHIADRPWFGAGFGRDLPHMVYPAPIHWETLMHAHAHNLFLNYLLQLGIVGLGIFLIMIVYLVRQMLRLVSCGDSHIQALGILGIGIITAMITKNLTDDFFWRGNALFFWSLMGLILGYGHRVTVLRKVPACG